MRYHEAKIVDARFVVRRERADDGLRRLLAWSQEELGLDLADVGSRASTRS